MERNVKITAKLVGGTSDPPDGAVRDESRWYSIEVEGDMRTVGLIREDDSLVTSRSTETSVTVGIADKIGEIRRRTGRVPSEYMESYQVKF